MNRDQKQHFLDCVKSEREELQEDLMGLPINTFKKIGDFGCGWGYITWSLLQEISVSECIGIDKFDPEIPPVWYQVEAGFSLEKTQELSKQIDANKYPDFRQRDIISGKNIPSDFDLIYCKRLLYNIFNEKRRIELDQAMNYPAASGRGIAPLKQFKLLDM